MTDVDEVSDPISEPEAQRTVPSYRDPSADQVLQVGLLAWGIFTVLVVVLGFAASLMSGSDVGSSIQGALWVSVISTVIAFVAMLVIGLPLGMILTRVMIQFTHKTLHAIAFGVLALAISLTINLLFWNGMLAPAITLSLLATVATVAGWCLRWIAFDRPAGNPAPARAGEVSTGSTRDVD